MKKYTITAGITALLLAVFLTASFALLPIAKAQDNEENQCEIWYSEQLQTPKGIDRLLTIALDAQAGVLLANQDDVCEAWFYTSFNGINSEGLINLLSQFLLISKAESELNK